MPAASAISRVVVPEKPSRANSGTAALTIALRRSSESSRGLAMRAEVSAYLPSVKVGQAAKEGSKKNGRSPPETAHWMCGVGLPYSPESPRIRPHADHGTGLARRRNRRFRRPQTYPRKSALTPAATSVLPRLIHRPVERQAMPDHRPCVLRLLALLALRMSKSLLLYPNCSSS